MYKEAIRPVWAEINLANLDYNIKSIREKIGPAPAIIGIVKADGYGHGAFEVVQTLKNNGVKSFGVATLQEAVTLREQGVDDEIITLGLTPDFYKSVTVEYGLTPVVCSYQNALAISDEAGKYGKTINGLIAIDTGMGRIGFPDSDPDAAPEIGKISELPNFKIKGLISHFSTSDEADKTYATEQGKRFLAFQDKLTSAGISINFRTFANSGAIMQFPSSYYDAVRPGIILYGCYPCDESDRTQISLKQVMSVKANIVLLKKVPPGTSISYGRHFTTERDSLIATISLGYADGYPRPLSGKAKVIVGGRFAKIAGNICMDQCMIDVTDVPSVKPGDEVIITGSDGINTIPIDEIARETGTICNEIVCAFGQRLPKVYIR